MASLFLVLVVSALFIAFVAAVLYVVVTVRSHMEDSPEAAKAIYEHVFLPVFVGTTEPEKPATTQLPDPEIEPDEVKL